MIIGISGKIGTGKSTLANYLLNKLQSLPYIKKAYGDFLKEKTSSLFKYPLEWNYTEEGKNRQVKHEFIPGEVMTVRKILQWYGTEVVRSIKPDYWVDCMQKYLEINKNVIIDDIRFPNEAQVVKDNKGILIRLEPYEIWEPKYTYANHASEISLDCYSGFDLIYKPEFGTLEVLSENILTTLSEVL